MRGDLPIPGSTRAKLLNAGMERFREQPYALVDVDSLAASAGVTVGALYHHFQSKLAFYGVLRDEMTLRVLDRMEAAVAMVEPEQALAAAVLAAYDGTLRIRAGLLISAADPREQPDRIAAYLGGLATTAGHEAGAQIGVILVAALRAALAEALAGRDARAALRAVVMR